MFAPHHIFIIIFFFALSIYLESLSLYIISYIILFFILFFYRPSLSAVSNEPNYILSPADGKVIDVVYHPHLNQYQVAIFLNIFNIHRQYAPCDGIITKRIYKPGQFEPAYLFEKSQYNERMITEIMNPKGIVAVVQIAGLLARRITTYYTPGKRIAQGQEIGMIHLGSRVDVWVSADDAHPLIMKNQIIEIGDPLFGWGKDPVRVVE